MRRSSFVFALLSLLLPAQVLAADLSPSQLLGLPLFEQKPVNFTLSVSQNVGSVKTSLVSRGAREGVSPDKFWAFVTLKRSSGAASMHVSFDVRVVHGMAYIRITDIGGSDSMIDVPGLKALGQQWYSVSQNALSFQKWTMPPLEPDLLAGSFNVKHELFQSGGSYTLSLVSGEAESVIASLLRQLPDPSQSSSLLSSDKLSFKLKVDTTRSGEYRFSQLSIQNPTVTVVSKVQRQMSPVNVETPKNSVALTSDALRALLGVMPTGSTSTVLPAQANYDIGTELHLPIDGNTSAARLMQRNAELALIHLYGGGGRDVRLTVRVADKQLKWDSLSAFTYDFRQNAGVLYIYPNPIIPTFTSKDIFEPVDVLFFDDTGSFVSALSLKKCETVVCPELKPSKPVKYAVEVSYGFLIKNQVDLLWRLSLRRSPIASSTVPGIRSIIDRIARQRAEDPLSAPPIPVRPIDISEMGNERLITLATLLSAKIRPADLRQAFVEDSSGPAVKSLYDLLSDMQHANSSVTYAYILKPATAEDAFQLIVDSFTLAPLSVLDTNHNGTIDADERPAVVGTTYLHYLFTPALSGPVVDSTLGTDIAVYVPVRDEEGNAIAVLGIVEKK